MREQPRRDGRNGRKENRTNMCSLMKFAKKKEVTIVCGWISQLKKKSIHHDSTRERINAFVSNSSIASEILARRLSSSVSSVVPILFTLNISNKTTQSPSSLLGSLNRLIQIARRGTYLRMISESQPGAWPVLDPSKFHKARSSTLVTSLSSTRLQSMASCGRQRTR